VVLIFDLDDTLYPEISYVESGFRAVSAFLETQFGWPREASLEFLKKVFATEGRGALCRHA
jgi:putative hydrolase of the HAD superfamily